MKDIHTALITALHAHAKQLQYQRAVVGLSGGLDSAVVFYLAVRAFGAKNVTALIMPEVGLTPNEDIDHAKILADHFGAQQHYQPINNFLVDFSFVPWPKNEEASANIKAHMRSILLRHYATSQGALFLGTANKSDLTLGFGTREGEFAGDVHVLGDVYKSEVLELAHYINLPEQLVEKDSTRLLKPYQTDEGDLGAPWGKIDEIIEQLNRGIDPDTMIQKGMDSLSVHKITRMIQQNEHKQKLIPILPAGNVQAALKAARKKEASS